MKADWSKAPEWAQWYTEDRLSSYWFGHEPEFDHHHNVYLASRGRTAMRANSSFRPYKEQRPTKEHTVTKKYRTKIDHYPVVIYTEQGIDKTFPVVFECITGPGEGDSLVSKTRPLDHPACNIEEVPQEPIKVGDTFGKYTVVFIDPERSSDAQHLCVYKNGNGYSDAWITKEDLRKQVSS